MDLRSRLATALLAAAGLAAAGWWGYRQLDALLALTADPSALVVPLVTLAVGGTTYGLLRRFAPVVPVLEHELAHAAAAIAMLGRPVEIHANEREGHAVHTAVGLRGAVVRLAPYALPTVPLVVLPLGWVLREDLLPLWQVALGVAVGYQLTRIAADLRPAQPDLRRGGLLASLLAVTGWGAVGFGSLLLLLVSK